MSELTFGQKLVGIGFNPSADPKVQRVKELCAELADLLKEDLNEFEQSPDCNIDDFQIKYLIHNGATSQILSAQMMAVKYLTFKP